MLRLAEKEVAAQAKERHAWTQVSIRRPGGFFFGSRGPLRPGSAAAPRGHSGAE